MPVADPLSDALDEVGDGGRLEQVAECYVDPEDLADSLHDLSGQERVTA